MKKYNTRSCMKQQLCKTTTAAGGARTREFGRQRVDAEAQELQARVAGEVREVP